MPVRRRKRCDIDGLGTETSVGSVRISDDNASAETIPGPFKAEAILRRGPRRPFEAVEYATLEWLDWYNHRRLFALTGHVTPAEADVCDHGNVADQALAA